MECKHFGICGSCKIYDKSYEEQLSIKASRVKELLLPYYQGEFDIFKSPTSNYRARAEFRIWHNEDRECQYAMNSFDKRVFEIDECPKVLEPIEKRMYKILEQINSSNTLSNRLFAVEFLSATTDEVLLTMIYHRKLDDEWIKEAKELESIADISIIGRSRKQKLVISKEFVTEKLKIKDRVFTYRHYEGGFTQPNPYVNQKMIEWAFNRCENLGGDLLESYCGLGNFTLPLSQLFERVLATEISKNSIKSAKENLELNGIDNVKFARLSSLEMTEALNKKRAFRRLEGIDLDSYNFTTALVDPPRAGLDDETKELISKIDNIVYISCNPDTLSRDLARLTQTHRVVRGAVFDQFPYTTHIESGVFLQRIKNA